MNEMQSGEWMKDSSLQAIPMSKLEFIQLLLFESKNLKNEEMLPFFMSVMKISKEKKISYSEEEMNSILSVIKKYVPAEDVKKINQILQMSKTI